MHRKANFNYFIFFLLIAITILILGRLQVLNFPADLLGQIANPARHVFSVKPSDSEIEKEKQELLVKISDEQKLISENKALSDQFKTTFPSSQNLIPASVLGSPNFIPGVTIPRTLILDKGGDDGVKENQAVVSGKNIIGKISKTSAHFSVAVLITNPQVSLTAKTDKDAIGVVKGIGNEEVILDNVILSQNLTKGDIVFTKGDEDVNGNGTSPDLIIGKIISVSKKSSELFQQASLRSFVDFSKLSKVFILAD